jgi:CelD/BcsL family acetyltransferase involved in cellulose biosynthesis
MRTRVLSAAERPAAKQVWTALQEEIGAPGMMCSWEWTGTWLEHYADVVAHRFVVGEDERGVRGIALIVEHRFRALRPPTIALGTAGEPPGSSVFVERNQLLVQPEDRAAFATALLADLERDRRWHRLCLDGMIPDDADLLVEGRGGVRRRVEQSPVANLAAGDDTDDPLGSLSSATRRRVRQSLKRLGPLETEWAETGPAARAILEELAELHQAHWRAQGEPGAFASSRFSGFHLDLVSQLVPLRRAALFRVRRQGETIACLYGLIEGTRILFYQSGLLRHDDNRIRVGLAAHALFMQACREHGLTAYEFLPPAARYKRELASESEQLVWVELDRPGLRLYFEKIARSAKGRVVKADRS